MSHRFKRSRRKMPAGEQFITLFHWMLKSPAYFALSGNAAKLITLLARRYNGYNNPGVTMSIREASRELGCARNTAAAAFVELQRIGFIEIAQRGAFSLKTRHATSWHLCWLPTRTPTGDLRDAAKRFMSYQAGQERPKNVKQNAHARIETDGLNQCSTQLSKFETAGN